MVLSLFNLVIYLSTKRIYGLFPMFLLIHCRSTLTVFSFNVSPMRRRKTPCLDDSVQFQIITLFQLLDEETTGFQNERNMRAHKYC